MKTIYQIFLILLIASFLLFMFASCTNSKSISKLHSCNENDETNTAIVLNKQIISKSDTVVVLANESWTNEDDDDRDYKPMSLNDINDKIVPQFDKWIKLII